MGTVKPMTTTAATITPRNSDTAVAPQLRGWVEIFTAGKHVDAKGRELTVSTDDLDEMVSNQQLGRAPAVLGHPKHDDPAYAWVGELRRDGASLFARFDDINPAFDDGVALGAYRNRSVKVVRDKANGMRLWHVGWLGAQPPAIDGLAPVGREFAAADDESAYEFAAAEDAAQSLTWAVDGLARLLRGLRDHVIEQESVEVADRVLPTWQIDDVVSTAQRARDRLAAESTPSNLFSHPGDDPMSNITLTPQQLEEKLAEARALAAKEAEDRVTSQFSAQGAELSELRSKRRDERVGSLINDWKAKGVIVAADEVGLREFMAGLDNTQVFEFSAASGSEPVKKAPLDWFAEFMAARKPVLKLGRVEGETHEPLDASDPAAISARAHAFQKAEAENGRTVSFELAVDHVTKQAA
jgi:hypothetical protein